MKSLILFLLFLSPFSTQATGWEDYQDKNEFMSPVLERFFASVESLKSEFEISSKSRFSIAGARAPEHWDICEHMSESFLKYWATQENYPTESIKVQTIKKIDLSLKLINILSVISFSNSRLSTIYRNFLNDENELLNVTFGQVTSNSKKMSSLFICDPVTNELARLGRIDRN